MGLDVSLHKCKDWDKALALKSEFSQKEDAIWEEIRGNKSWDELSDWIAELARTKIRAIKEEMGLELDDYPKFGIETIEKPHPEYPDHLNKIGYFHSSYNEGGMNYYFHRLGVPDLYSIFSVGEDYDYYIKVDWKDAFERCEFAIEKYKEIKNSPIGKYDCCFFIRSYGSQDNTINSEHEALNLFQTQLEKKLERLAPLEPDVPVKSEDDLDWYSMGAGDYIFPHLKVSALIRGNRWGQPCMYVIYEKIEDAEDWYLQALEIVRDTICYVLAHLNPDDFRLGWSS